MNLNFKFATLVLDARLNAGLTQSQVAECVSISTRWYQKIESGSTMPGSFTMLKLILFLKIDVNKLEEVIEFVEPVCTNTRKIIKSRR